MSEAKIAAFEALLTSAVEEFLSSGGKLIANRFGSTGRYHDKHACPIQVLCQSLTGNVYQVAPYEFLSELKKKTSFSFSEEDIVAFFLGFDGKSKCDNMFHAVGVRWREKYNPD